MQLPIKLPFDLLTTKWASILNPVLALPILQGNQINGIKLTANTPLAINHLLSRMQQGWLITDINSATLVWRTQPLNAQTLTLEANANTTINLWCF